MKIKYYLSSSGRSPVEDFLAECSSDIRSDFLDALSMLESGLSLAMPLSRNLSAIHPGLHELRLKDRSGQIRVFYFLKRGEAIYLLHAIKKKTQEIRKPEIDLILKRLKEV